MAVLIDVERGGTHSGIIFEPTYGCQLRDASYPLDERRITAALSEIDSALATVRRGSGGVTAPDLGYALIEAAAREHGIPPPPASPQQPVAWHPTEIARQRVEDERGVIILGGYGGIALSLANRLSASGCTVALVDKRPLHTLSSVTLRYLGDLVRRGTVLLIGPVSALNRALPRLPSQRLTVVHTAGSLELKQATQISHRDLVRQFTAKTDPLNEMLGQLGSRQCPQIITVGSTEARYSHRGFGLYSLANEVLRHHAAALSRIGYAVAHVESTLWERVGMGRRAAAMAAAHGHAVIEPSWGCAVIESIIATKRRPGDWSELVIGGAGTSAERPLQFITGIGGACSSGDLAAHSRLVSATAVGSRQAVVTRSQHNILARAYSA